MNKERLTIIGLTVIIIPIILLSNALVSEGEYVTNHTTSNATPIKHLVVIFQENVAFDHYFSTYPYTANTSVEHPFLYSPNTLSINGLTAPGLLTSNTNLANPFRLDRSQSSIIASCDPDHEYTAIQKSFDSWLMDKFCSEFRASIPEKL